MPELKHHWRTLRSFYCNRYLRMKRGQIAPDHPLLHEPVYLMLRKIFGDESSGGGEEGDSTLIKTTCTSPPVAK
ncbi:hypothetical protein pipiens_011346 [Culex pipiens pipiens]|uniref:MADF domain-containing protein n=1 Tax=Culex pipiens pipiens TaxID=38569 RepID=A0ABD1D6R4_CULPP